MTRDLRYRFAQLNTWLGSNVEKDMADTINACGVYALSYRRHDEPPMARHWAYYLSAARMESAMARAKANGAPIVIRSAGWLSVDDMLDMSNPAFN